MSEVNQTRTGKCHVSSHAESRYLFLKTLKRKRDYLEKVSEGEMRTREGDEVNVIKMLYAYMKMLQ